MGIKVNNTFLAADALKEELKKIKLTKLFNEFKVNNPNLSKEEYKLKLKELEEKVNNEEK
ncbi:hypothetical protein LJB88_03465 [Erysipelotrichaceae bacterium OttesenSCG-928-M19]|nr:hypothetical protein [Erysipelotrichaceae bacterium OttesenSCG-928-M19]